MTAERMKAGAKATHDLRIEEKETPSTPDETQKTLPPGTPMKKVGEEKTTSYEGSILPPNLTVKKEKREIYRVQES